VLRPYQNDKKGSEIVNRWHAANKKSDKKAKKAKLKDNPADYGTSRQSGFSTPRTDTEHKKDIGVDGLPDLDDAPLKFQYGKDLLPDWALRDCPSFMRMFHNWYKMACIVGLKTIYAPHHPDVFGLMGHQIFDIMFIQHMFRHQHFGIEMVRLLIDTNLIYVTT
jgi:hypothetical protein